MAIKTNEQVAAEWRAKAGSDGEWVYCHNQSGGSGPGEAGGYNASCDKEAKGRTVYLKPQRADNGVFRAAREKIASDLACDLGFRVPPVLLAESRRLGEESRVCVSLKMSPSQRSWKELVPYLNGARTPSAATKEFWKVVAERLPAAAGAALAFDTWVKQDDHHENNGHNVILTYDGARTEAVGYAFLDYAWAFAPERVQFPDGRWVPGNAWAAGGHQNCVAAPAHPIMLQRLDKKTCADMINKIQGLNNTVIGDVVHRIPDAYMSAAVKDLIFTALCARKALLPQALASLL